MLKTNYHTHCDFCDGKGPALDYYLQAKQRGLAALGFSSHATVPFENDFAIPEDQLLHYVETIQALKQRAASEAGPQVYLGLEIEFIPGVCAPADSNWDALALDYKIGSVHALRLPQQDKPMLAVDSGIEDFLHLWREEYGEDTRAMVSDYFELVGELCKQGGFDVLGHYDLIKKNNPACGFLDETAEYYREAAIDTLDHVKRAGVVMEINSGGIARGALKEIYPAPWLLKEARLRQIPIQINADAHYPEHVDFHFEQSAELARQTGYTSVRVLLDGVWQDVAL